MQLEEGLLEVSSFLLQAGMSNEVPIYTTNEGILPAARPFQAYNRAVICVNRDHASSQASPHLRRNRQIISTQTTTRRLLACYPTYTRRHSGIYQRRHQEVATSRESGKPA